MNLTNDEAKEKLLNRLRRIEGQVHGVQTMVQEERDCREILQQLSAVRSAVQNASALFLEEYVSTCLIQLDTENPQEREAFAADLIALLGKSSG